MSSACLEFLPQVPFTLNVVSWFRNERFRELENRFQNCRGLAHFAESSEQNVPVPFSEAVLKPVLDSLLSHVRIVS